MPASGLKFEDSIPDIDGMTDDEWKQHLTDVDWKNREAEEQWQSMPDGEKKRLVRDRMQQRARDAGIEAANQKDWPKAFKLAKESGEYSGIVWATIGGSADSEPVVRDALKHVEGDEQGLGELLYEVAANQHFQKPEHALSGELMQHMTDLAMQPHSKLPGVFRSASQRFTKHPNYDKGPHEAAQFWENYEQSVDPAHFATMEHHLTGQPTTLTDHRGETGSSADYPHALPHLEKYAQRAREALKGDADAKVWNSSTGRSEPIMRKVRGKHYVKVHRGIAGDYAEAIGRQAGLDEEGNVDRAVLKIPTAAMSSWTVDPDVARGFAGRRISGQSRKGLIMSKWMPLDHLMHSGFHDVIPDHRHAHPQESELVFKHPERHVKVPTSSLNIVKELPHSPQRIEEERRIHWRNLLSNDETHAVHTLQKLGQERPDVKRFMDEPTPDEESAFMNMLHEQTAPYHDTSTPSKHVPWMKMARQYVPELFPSFDNEGVPHEHLMQQQLNSLPKKKVVEPVKVREQNEIEAPHPLRPVKMGKSEDWARQELMKMALADIAPGQPTGQPQTFDYSHVLKPEHRAAGYSVNVHQQDGLMSARVRHNGNDLGGVWSGVEGDTLTGPSAGLHSPKHRGLGLGKAAYEALYAHAVHNGIRKVVGGGHSEAASRVHQSLAVKHGLSYQATDGSKQYWTGRKGPYEYMLKSEFDEYELWHNPTPPTYTVGVRHKLTGQDVGQATFATDRDDAGARIGLRGWQVDVKEPHRRKGLATAMYRHAEKMYGMPVQPGTFQTPDGKKFVASLIKKSEQAQFEELMKSAGFEVKSLSKAEIPFDPDSRIVHAMLGHNKKLNTSVEAARFLAGGGPHDPKVLRQHLWQTDGDHEKAALLHYGIEPDEKSMRALRAVKTFAFRKDEPLLHLGKTVEAALPEGQDTAESVNRAFEVGAVKEVHLGGKHSHGTLLAHDDKGGKTWLLKPGSGPQNPAAGENEQPATQSEREVAFYQVVTSWGIGNFYPHTDLVIIEGQQYAALEMLPPSYETINDIKADHPGMPRHLFLPYLKNGILHKWAFADWVLGQVDRNDGNIMAQMEKTPDGLDRLPSMSETENVKLIDEGSAWAGVDFDPAHDQYSFVPGYLRAWFDGNFNQLPPEEKLKAVPRVDEESEKMLRDWIGGLDQATMSVIARKYNVDPSAAEMRLANLKSAIEHKPVDLVLNELWTVGATR